jgi:thiamine biosynthesis protein ThiC
MARGDIRCSWWGRCQDIRKHEYYDRGFHAGWMQRNSEKDHLLEYYREVNEKCFKERHLRALGKGMRAGDV